MDARAGLTELVGACIRDADFAPIEGRYASGATLEALFPGGRIVRRGPEAIVATFASWWPEPSPIVDTWSATYRTGIQLRLERERADVECARHLTHHLHLRNGLISRHVVVPRPARHGVVFPDAPEGSLLARAWERAPLLHDGLSGSLLERIVLDDGRPLVVKHLSRRWDWIARATDDPGREALLFADGTFGRLPPGIDPAVVAVEEAEDGWRLYLRDVSEALERRDPLVSREDNRRTFELLAEMHRTFLGHPVPHVATAERRISFLTPPTAAREQGCEYFLRVVDRGAELLPTLIAPELVEALHAIANDPAPLAAVLSASGATLVHGDVRYQNIGFTPDGVVLIDWGLATLAPPAVDLAFFLSSGAVDVAATRDEVMADMRQIWGGLVDDRSLALALLAEATSTIWFEAMRIHDHADERERSRSADELRWWAERAREALDRHWSPPS